MPKPKTSAGDLVSGGGFVIEGKLEVVDARFKLIGRTKKDGSAVTPFCALQFDLIQLDDEWNRTPESEELGGVQKEFIVCWQNKKDGTFKFRPGLADSATEDPEDGGDEIDVEGPTLYCDDSSVPFADSDFGMLLASLESKGFKPEVNAQAWAGNYVGMKFEVESKTPTELCKALNIKHQAREKEQPVWSIVDIHVFPYDKKASKSTANVKAATKPNGKTMAAADVDEEESSVEVNPVSADVLKKFGEANSGKTLTRKQLQTQLGSFMQSKYKNDQGKKLQMQQMTTVIEDVRDDEKFGALAMTLEWETGKGGTEVTFG